MPTSSCAMARELVATSADSALNLLDATHFFVCGSQIDGMNGRYIVSDELQSDTETPVFVREDEEIDQDDAMSQQYDFRLYRHHGFWLFADVAQWPPKTHFRCDPTKDGASESCAGNLMTPPRVGYAAASGDHTVAHIELYDQDCDATPLRTPNAEL